MILVRDKTKSKTEYKGRDTYAVNPECPCRSCWNSHDCGRINSVGKWVACVHCATNWNSGCPSAFTTRHMIKNNRSRKCSRCGKTLTLTDKQNAIIIPKEAKNG